MGEFLTRGLRAIRMASGHRAEATFSLLAILALAAPLAAEAAEPVAGPVTAEVVEVIDGDTLSVRAKIWPQHWVVTKIRLAGIDAPELKGACARERDLARRAAVFVENRLGTPGATTTPPAIKLYDVRLGKFAGRVLARVESLDGLDLGAALVTAGLARPYNGRRRSSWCELAERD